MKALILRQKNKWPTWSDIEAPAQEGTVEVKLLASALNHRDLWIVRGMYAGIKLPAVLGSDGCGVYKDQRVIINPNIGWGQQEAFQSRSYRILGMPSFGTFAEHICIAEDRLHPAPTHLTDEGVAALPIAGLTAYRALFVKAGLRSSDRVLINGVGGGVAMMAFLMALAAGAEVYVSSSDARKRQKSLKMGATQAFNYKKEGWGKLLYSEFGGVDIVIDSAGGDGFTELIDAAKPGARIVTYGGSSGKMNGLSPQVIFWKQLSILGTTMGSDQDFVRMLDYVALHKIQPVIDEVFDIKKGEHAFIKLSKAKQFGKIVLKH